MARADSETAEEEQEGRLIWQNLQSGQTSCQNLSEGDYELLGEYFMGTMMGDSHEAMNAMLEQRLGKEGEERMHIAMGKRMSGCDTSAQYPQGFNFMPMMGVWSSPTGFNQNNNNSMMWGFGNNPMGWGFGLFGLIFMLLFWILIVAGIVILIKWLVSQSHGTHGHEKPPLDILKERYAKGELNKEEFEAKKKDLGL
ncbi:MAG: SHOCT domain-containing protein [Patescibacteria group bacterium]|nr:SHOCT domain-containing protein [Patescibacteria group bacterium]